MLECPGLSPWFSSLSILTFLGISTYHLGLSFEPQTYTSNCLLDIFTWISNRHLKFRSSKTKFLIFPTKFLHLHFPLASPTSCFSGPKSRSPPFFLHQSMCQQSLGKTSRTQSPFTTPTAHFWAEPSSCVHRRGGK